MEQELEQENKATAKTHKEIVEIIEEIKAFENKYNEYDLSKISVNENAGEDLIEFEPKLPEIQKTKPERRFAFRKKKESMQAPEVALEKEKKTKKQKKEKKSKKITESENKEKLEPAQESVQPKLEEAKTEEPKAKSPANAAFKLRFDGTGNLEMLGAKKPQAKPETKKEKKKKEPKERGEKASKLKGGLGKIKNVVPRRGKNKEEAKEEK